MFAYYHNFKYSGYSRTANAISLQTSRQHVNSIFCIREIFYLVIPLNIILLLYVIASPLNLTDTFLSSGISFGTTHLQRGMCKILRLVRRRSIAWFRVFRVWREIGSGNFYGCELGQMWGDLNAGYGIMIWSKDYISLNLANVIHHLKSCVQQLLPYITLHLSEYAATIAIYKAN